MIVERIWTGNAYRNFNYLIACPQTGEALAIDPLDHVKCLAAAKAEGWTITQILNTHEHLDHAGGLAKLKQITGAQFAVREAAKAAVETGLPQADDPQHGLHPAFPGIKADRIIGDGQTLRIGKQSITVMATPGHSPGGTSYTWESCEQGDCRPEALGGHDGSVLSRLATPILESAMP